MHKCKAPTQRPLCNIGPHSQRRPTVWPALMLSILTLLGLGTASAYAQKPVSAGKIYQETETIVLLLEALRTHLKIKKAPEAPPIQAGKQPIHLLSKTLELRESLVAILTKYKLPNNYQTTALPVTEPTLADVYEQTQQVTATLEKTAKRLGAKMPKPKGGWALAKSPSDVYRQLAYAKSLVHTITGPVSPKVVYQHAAEILAEQNLLAKKLNTQLPTKKPSLSSQNGNPEQQNIAPIDLNIQAQRSLLYTAFLQRKLDMDVFTIPEMNGSVFTTSDVDNTLRLILAELTRIKINLSINHQATVSTPSTKKVSMKDILGQLHTSAANFEKLIE